MTTNKEQIAIQKKYEKAHPKKTKKAKKTRSNINNAVRDNRMKKPSKCPRCGSTTNRIEWDHHSKPPGWSCSKCNPHGKEGKKR